VRGRIARFDRLAGPWSRRGHLTLVPVPEDVLQHDDRVVDEHSHTQGETTQGHHVQADVEQITE
jgi:hypothetical protein